MATTVSFCPPLLPVPRATLHDSQLKVALPFPVTTHTKPQPLLRTRHAPTPLHIVCGRRPRGTKDFQIAKPDPVYQNRLLSLFINRILKNGKKSLALQILYRALKRVQVRTESNPLVVLRDAVSNVTPDVTVKSRRVGGATQQVPVEIGASQGRALAIRWLLSAARKRQGKSMVNKLSAELLDAASGSGEAVKQKEATHKMAEANRAFAHFR